MLTAKELSIFQKACTVKRMRQEQKTIEKKIEEIAETYSGRNRAFHRVWNIQQDDINYLVTWLEKLGYKVKVVDRVFYHCGKDVSATLIIKWDCND